MLGLQGSSNGYTRDDGKYRISWLRVMDKNIQNWVITRAYLGGSAAPGKRMLVSCSVAVGIWKRQLTGTLNHSSNAGLTSTMDL
jgi:hypothetical protein